MSATLPIVTFFLFWFGFYCQIKNGCQAFIYAAALWGILVWLLTEILSLIHWISFSPLLVSWLLILGGAAYWALSCHKALQWKYKVNFLKTLTATEKILLFFILTIACLKGFSAIFSAPNTSDAMTYHLPRVEHWIQNKTVEHYPTHVLRQLYSLPWAEYAILQFRVLSGSDYFSNAVQWFSSVGSWIVVASLTKILGGGRPAQLFSVVLAATLPMGLVQSTSTQNDYIMTFWLIAFIYLLILVFKEKQLMQALAAGVCLGLAILSKGNAFLYAPVWIVLFITFSLIKKDAHQLKLIGLILVVVLTINLPYALRNIRTFEQPYWTHHSVTNKTVTPSLLVANLMGNVALHLGTPWEHMNHKIYECVKKAIQVTGFDLKNPLPGTWMDPVTTISMSTGEDDSPNGIVLILFLIALFLLLFHGPIRNKEHMYYAVAILIMILIFSAAIRNNSYNSRYQLAIFVLACPLVGLVFSSLLKRWTIILTLGVVFLSWPWLLRCNEHPFLGPKSILMTTRQQQYFSQRPEMMFVYEQIFKIAESSNCRDIGFIDGEVEWGYPWWVMFHQKYGQSFRFEDVEITNRTSTLTYPLGTFNPCMIISSNDTKEVFVFDKEVFVRAWFVQLPTSLTSVFVRVPSSG